MEDEPRCEDAGMPSSLRLHENWCLDVIQVWKIRGAAIAVTGLAPDADHAGDGLPDQPGADGRAVQVRAAMHAHRLAGRRWTLTALIDPQPRAGWTSVS